MAESVEAADLAPCAGAGLNLSSEEQESLDNYVEGKHKLPVGNTKNGGQCLEECFSTKGMSRPPMLMVVVENQ